MEIRILSYTNHGEETARRVSLALERGGHR